MMWRPPLAADRRGVAATEFAIVAPFLLLLSLGVFNLAAASALGRKNTAAARTVADLVSQAPSVSRSDLSAFLGLRATLVAPFRQEATLSRVTQVHTDDSGNAMVSWSYATAGSAMQTGAAFALPDDLHIPRLSYIVVDLQTEYRPQGGMLGLPLLPISERVTMLPRLGHDVRCDDC